MYIRCVFAPFKRPNVRPCVWARVWVWVCALSVPDCASPFFRRGPLAARLAGGFLCFGIQRGHQQMEHRVGVEHVRHVRARDRLQRRHQLMEYSASGEHDPGMRRFRHAARHRGGRARPGFDAARPLCAAAPPKRTHVCVSDRRSV
jgi:hypothetical protein